MFNRWKFLIFWNSIIKLSIYIQLIWNIPENKVDFENLDKLKYLGPNLSKNKAILSKSKILPIIDCFYYKLLKKSPVKQFGLFYGK